MVQGIRQFAVQRLKTPKPATKVKGDTKDAGGGEGSRLDRLKELRHELQEEHGVLWRWPPKLRRTRRTIEPLEQLADLDHRRIELLGRSKNGVHEGQEGDRRSEDRVHEGQEPLEHHP